LDITESTMNGNKTIRKQLIFEGILNVLMLFSCRLDYLILLLKKKKILKNKIKNIDLSIIVIYLNKY
jgi:hypothetical protein